MAFAVLFRLDDICPGMNYENFKRFRDLFNRYGVKPIIGVVPENKDDNLNQGSMIPDFWDMIRELKDHGWSIAMHGHTHVYTTKDSGIFQRGDKSEFAGLPYHLQYEKIQRGIEILRQHGLPTELFMAPSNSVDENTMRALKECGFRYITIGSAKEPYQWHGLTILPCRDFKPKRRNHFCTVQLHPNTAPERIFLITERFLEKYSKYVISFSDACQRPLIPLTKARLQEKTYLLIQNHFVKRIYPIYKKFGDNPWTRNIIEVYRFK